MYKSQYNLNIHQNKQGIDEHSDRNSYQQYKHSDYHHQQYFQHFYRFHQFLWIHFYIDKSIHPIQS